MQIVIDIPEKLYEAYKGRPPMLGDVGMDMIAQSIANGTPLPKGHGRLVDVSEYFKKEFGDARKFLDNATTIIEADGGGADDR